MRVCDSWPLFELLEFVVNDLQDVLRHQTQLRGLDDELLHEGTKPAKFSDFSRPGAWSAT